MTITLNPALTTRPQNTFLAQTEGFTQGVALDDPAIRTQLVTGVLGASVDPVYGSLPIVETIAPPNADVLGNVITLAAGAATIGGFLVFDQAYNGLIVPGNSVPQYAEGQTVSLYRLGSRARVAVKINASDIGTFDTGNTNQVVSWDFVNAVLIPGSSATIPVKVIGVNANAKVIKNTGGVLTWDVGAVAIIQL